MSFLFKQGIFSSEKEYKEELAKEIQKIKKEYNIKDQENIMKKIIDFFRKSNYN